MSKSTFTFDGSDPDDRTGLSQEEYDDLIQGLMELGAYDINVEGE